jgi:hypothetical protein
MNTPVTETTEVTETKTYTRELNLGRLALGTILVVGGIGWLLDAANIIKFDWAIFLAIALIAVGIAIIGLGSRARSRGALLALGTVLTVILAIGSIDPLRTGISAGRRNQSQGLGERVVTPRNAGEIPDRYRLQFGQLMLDLSDLDLRAGTTTINASVGMGQLIVRVPEDTAVNVEAKMGGGEIKIFDRTERSGANISESFSTENYSSAARRVALKLVVGFGTIEVNRAS